MSLALRPCAQPGCPSLVQKGRCTTHAKQQDIARGTAQERGYDSRWAAYSRQFRAEHPTCGEQHDGTLDDTHSRCLQNGRMEPAECVTHFLTVGSVQFANLTSLQFSVYGWGLVSNVAEFSNLENMALRVFAYNDGAGDFTGGDSTNVLRISVTYLILNTSTGLFE